MGYFYYYFGFFCVLWIIFSMVYGGSFWSLLFNILVGWVIIFFYLGCDYLGIEGEDYVGWRWCGSCCLGVSLCVLYWWKKKENIDRYRNYVFYVLFLLILMDVLILFVDLFEDVFIEEVLFIVVGYFFFVILILYLMK